jgi:hypothetical protein
VDHFIPGLAVDRSTDGATAGIGLSFYFFPAASCSADTCQLNVGFISSSNGGANWGGPSQLNPQPMALSWLADTSWPGRMVGDYISTSFAGGRAVSVFALASAPSGGTLHEAMAAASLLVGSPPTPTPAPTQTPTPTPTCPNGAGPPWPIPAGDPDCDGFSTAVENFVGTDPTRPCGVNAWPVDMTNDQKVSLTDVLAYAPVIGTQQGMPPPPGKSPYSQRFDINGDNRVSLSDVLAFAPFFGESCTP